MANKKTDKKSRYPILHERSPKFNDNVTPLLQGGAMERKVKSKSAN